MLVSLSDKALQALPRRMACLVKPSMSIARALQGDANAPCPKGAKKWQKFFVYRIRQIFSYGYSKNRFPPPPPEKRIKWPHKVSPYGAFFFCCSCQAPVSGVVRNGWHSIRKGCGQSAQFPFFVSCAHFSAKNSHFRIIFASFCVISAHFLNSSFKGSFPRQLWWQLRL